jgi:hypothetical protein
MRAFHMSEISRMYLHEHLTQHQIAQVLNISQQTVSHDLKLLMKEWREMASMDYQQWVAEEMVRLAMVEQVILSLETSDESGTPGTPETDVETLRTKGHGMENAMNTDGKALPEDESGDDGPLPWPVSLHSPCCSGSGSQTRGRKAFEASWIYYVFPAEPGRHVCTR